MSLIKLLPAWLHAVADYAVSLLLIAVALTVSMSGAARATGIVVGAVVLVVSMATKYPAGIVKVLPFRIHSLGDYAAAALLVIAPFALGFSSTDTAVSVLYVGAGVAVLGVSLITNYQYGSASNSVSFAGSDQTESVSRSAPASTETSSHSGTRRNRPLRAAGR